MRKIALIVAGGKGVRMGLGFPKQFLKLNNLPVLMHTINLFLHFDKIYVVISKEESENWKKLCKKYKFKVPILFVQEEKVDSNQLKMV